MMRNWKNLMALGVAVVVIMGLSGCNRGKDKSVFSGMDDVSSSSAGSETTTGEGLPNVDLENLLFDSSSSSGLQPIYFDFDSSSLGADALAILRENARKIKEVPSAIVQIAGHCDERGTQEYNLALGERRALAVREHLIQLGVSGDRLITISYGEEFPAATGQNEAAWSKNRRCEFNKARSL